MFVKIKRTRFVKKYTSVKIRINQGIIYVKYISVEVDRNGRLAQLEFCMGKVESVFIRYIGKSRGNMVKGRNIIRKNSSTFSLNILFR